jgi:hypothetical protein
VRGIAAAAGLFVALAAPPASSQPAPAAQSVGWRTAAAAALAFGYAEGKMLALGRHAISASPTTQKAADAAFDQLDRLASSARNGYLVVERYGSPFWTAAAENRMGDTFACQAEKIVAIPPPPQMTQGMSPSTKAAFLELMDGLVQPLREQAIPYWERAAASGSAFWAARARDRLAGITFPDC